MVVEKRPICRDRRSPSDRIESGQHFSRAKPGRMRPKFGRFRRIWANPHQTWADFEPTRPKSPHLGRIRPGPPLMNLCRLRVRHRQAPPPLPASALAPPPPSAASASCPFCGLGRRLSPLGRLRLCLGNLRLPFASAAPTCLRLGRLRRLPLRQPSSASELGENRCHKRSSTRWGVLFGGSLWRFWASPANLPGTTEFDPRALVATIPVQLRGL